ncbi:MAG TPA: hypothetical protein PK863_06310 [Candidatus Dojkabacteria bacterium]|nr:hypothetical protein [Candidatus Dojkabacteria bacterium]HRP51276.1 hypothetical protein [Candidatus Dojkabacteria bacterium]
MKTEDLLGKIKERFFSKWIACRLISDKKSVQYGIRFSYPVQILLVITGILLGNSFILIIVALIAFLGIKLPLHPFDYIYNFGVTMLIGTNLIPGRGSELKVNSFVVMVFNIVVVALITLEVPINYGVLAIIYALISLFFICIFLLKDSSHTE